MTIDDFKDTVDIDGATRYQLDTAKTLLAELHGVPVEEITDGDGLRFSALMLLHFLAEGKSLEAVTFAYVAIHHDPADLEDEWRALHDTHTS